MIGEYISALSNAAALCERPKAYLVWGVDDKTHKIVGTEFQYRKMKKGNEELEAWISRMLSPRINFRFFEVSMDEGMVVLLDYSKYYDKLETPIPRNRDKVLEDLQHEKFIKRNDAGTWDITNMGALMIAKDLRKFESSRRRTVRVIWYKEGCCQFSGNSHT